MDRLTEALEHAGGTHTLGDVLAAIESGEAQLWQTADAIIVSEIEQYPQMRVCNLWLAAGDLGAVIALGDEVIAWAKTEMGCERATLWGRKGWERLGRSRGWTPMLTLLSREV